MTELWKLLGKTTGPSPVTGWHDLEPGTREICLQFPEEGCTTFYFSWGATVIHGQKSVDKLVPDDPDTLICDSFFIDKVLNYDVLGTEFPVLVTPEIKTLFLNWVKATNLLNVDEYDL